VILLLYTPSVSVCNHPFIREKWCLHIGTKRVKTIVLRANHAHLSKISSIKKVFKNKGNSKKINYLKILEIKNNVRMA